MTRFDHAVPLLHDFLLASADRRAEATALVCGGTRLGYRDLRDRCVRLAWALIRRGVTPGDRVLVFADNHIDTVVSFWAALAANAVPVVISPQTRVDKLRYLLGDCEPRAAVVDESRAEIFRDAASTMVGAPTALLSREESTDGPAVVGEWLDQACAGESSQTPPPRRTIDIDLAAIIYTSGSTGDPKGVMHTHRSMRCAATSIAAYLENTEDDVILNVLPLSFDYGLYQMIMAFSVGARLVLERSFAFPADVLKRAAAERITGFPGVPTMYALLGTIKHLDEFDLSSVRYVTNTAAALPEKHVAVLKQAFPRARIYSMYGLTECKRVSYLPPADLERKPHSVGLPIPNTEVWIAGDDGQRLPPGEVGQVVVRGATVMRGYWRKPEETAKKLRPGPLPGEYVLYTGDLGKQDDEGYLYFLGRTDDIIKSRGEKVAPREIENALLKIGGVREVAVIGVDDELLGQAACAFVVLDGQVSLSAQDIQRACRSLLESHMVPKYIEFVLDLPKTTTGKVRTQSLRSLPRLRPSTQTEEAS